MNPDTSSKHGAEFHLCCTHIMVAIYDKITNVLYVYVVLVLPMKIGGNHHSSIVGKRKASHVRCDFRPFTVVL